MELLLVEAWLLTIAALNRVEISDAAVPVWLVGLALVVFGAISAYLRARSLGVTLVVLAGASIVLWAIAVRVSPAGYGNVPGGPLDFTWLSALGNDLATGAARLDQIFFGLLVVVCYLAWRGFAAGNETPSLESVLTRLKFGLGALIAAVLVGTTAQPAFRAPLIGALSLVLPGFVFVGLVASTLARIAREREYRRGDAPYVSRAGAWVRWSVVLAAGVIIIALLLSLVFNLSAVESGLRHLGPVGIALDHFITLLVTLWARLVGFLLSGPLDFLKAHQSIRQPPPDTGQPGRPPNTKQPEPAWVQVILLGFQAVIAAGALLLAGWLLYQLGRQIAARLARPRPENPDEERESLDGREVLRQQLRSLFGGSRRRSPARHADDLPRGSARWLFREVLRAGASAGMPRRPAETADEYGRRLAAQPAPAQAPTLDPADLGALSDAYDQARYDDTEPPERERGPLGERTTRITQALRRWARAKR